MKKRSLYISRQLLLGVIALQFLNLSVGSQAYWEGTYDYSYTYNKSYDPTETAILSPPPESTLPAFLYA